MPLLRSGLVPFVSHAGTPLLASPVTEPPPPDPSAEAAPARAWVAPLTIGVNVERFRASTLSYGTAPLRTNTAYWAYLKSLGFSHVRFSLPWRTQTDMSGLGWVNGVEPADADLDPLLDASETAIRAGLKVIYTCTDTVGADFLFYGAAIESVLARTAVRISQRGQTRLPPTMFAVSPFFALDFATNLECNGYRLAAHRILRERLPDYVLVTGAAKSSAPSLLLASDWQMTPDAKVICEIQEMVGTPTATFLQGQAINFAAFSAAHSGVPVMATSVAAGTQSYGTDWATHMDLYSTYLPQVRQTHWSITNGSWYNLATSTTDLTIRSALIYPIAKADATIQNSTAWKQANPGVTPKPIPPPPVVEPPPVDPPPTNPGTPTGAVTYEGFDANNSGRLGHTWGNRARVSYSGGILTIAGSMSDSNTSTTAAGVMETPGSTSTGHGHGLYEFRVRMTGGLGDGSGPAIGLWPSTDKWPGPEIDCGEIDSSGRFYCAHHWRGADGKDAYRIFPKAGHDWWNWHTYSCRLRRNHLEFFVNGVSIGFNTSNVTPVYADGGENRLLFTMNRSRNTKLEVDWVRFTPMAP